MKLLSIKLGVALSIAIFIVCSLFTSANADEPLYATYKQYKNTKEFKILVHGIGIGLEWAEATKATLKQPQLFCKPDGVSLTTDQYFRILQNYIESREAIADYYPIALILYRALAEKFPCK